MALRGIEFHTEESPQAIIKLPDGSLSLKTNKGTVDGFSHVMFATGRRPNTRVCVCPCLTLLPASKKHANLSIEQHLDWMIVLI